jgi:hypothetical protein
VVSRQTPQVTKPAEIIHGIKHLTAELTPK